MKDPMFKWIRVKFHISEEFPTQKFIERHFRGTLADLTNLYLHGKITPETQTIKFKTKGSGFELPENIMIPTPITGMEIGLSIHSKFPNAEWVMMHYPMLVKRLANLYMIGTINPTVDIVEFGIPRKKWEQTPSVSIPEGEKTHTQLLNSIRIEWVFDNNRNQEIPPIHPLITKYMEKKPSVIDVKQLVEDMEKNKLEVTWEDDEE